MNEKINFNGLWWLPDNSKEKILGTLEINGSEIKLVLNGIFLSSRREAEPIFSRYNIVNGFADGKDVTLLTCVQTQMMSYMGSGTNTYIVGSVLWGQCFSNEEEISFGNYDLKLTHLNSLFRIQHFKIEKHSRFVLPCNEDTKIEYNPKEDILIYDSAEYKIYLSYEFLSYHLPMYALDINKLDISLLPCLKIISKNGPIHYKLFLELVEKITSFIAFSVNKPVYIYEWSGYDNGCEDKLKYTRQIYYQNPHPKNVRIIHPDELLINGEITNISDLLNKWFALCNSIFYEIMVAIGILYELSDNGYIYTMLINIFTALESTHRSLFNGVFMDSNEYKNTILKTLTDYICRLKIKEELNGINEESKGNNEEFEDISKKFKDRLKDSLKYSYEYSLRQRLKLLYKNYKDILDNINGFNKVFLDRAVDTRNYLVHHDDSIIKPFEGTDLIDAIDKLSALFRIIILDQLGFDNHYIISKLGLFC